MILILITRDITINIASLIVILRQHHWPGTALRGYDKRQRRSTVRRHRCAQRVHAAPPGLRNREVLLARPGVASGWQLALSGARDSSEEQPEARLRRLAGCGACAESTTPVQKIRGGPGPPLAPPK